MSGSRYSSKVPAPGSTWGRAIVGSEFYETPHYVGRFQLPTTADELAPLRHMPHVRELVLEGCELQDEHLRQLANLTQCRFLSLFRNQITDDGLAHLAGLTELQMLSLGMNKIKGSGLVHLSRLCNLRQLGLGGNEIDNDELVHIAKLPALEHVTLENCYDINDAGLKHLAGMKNLRSLFITSAGVTTKGIEELKQATPGLQVMWRRTFTY